MITSLAEGELDIAEAVVRKWSNEETEAGVKRPRLSWVEFAAGVQDFRDFVAVPGSRQSQPAMPQAQEVAQVQTGSQLQLQFWQLQEAWDETGDLVGFVFMCDLVSSLSTESFAQSYTGYALSLVFRAALRGARCLRASTDCGRWTSEPSC